MKKGQAMKRLAQGARASKLVTTLLAASLFISPMAWAQDQSASTATDGAGQEQSSSGKGTLNFTPEAAPAAEDTTKIADASTSETDAAPAAEDGTAVAQSTGGSTVKRLDPAYKQLPTTTGQVDVRRNFKLFAKEELIHNLSFRDTPIKEVIAELAKRGNLNILLDNSVFGKVTGDLHDLTLNEAMDSILAATGLQYRVLDNNTVIVGSPNALGARGLNRTKAKVFKLSYITPFDVANILSVSVFNRGFIPDFTTAFKSKTQTASAENPKSQEETREDSKQAGIGEGGAQKNIEKRTSSTNTSESKTDEDAGSDYSFSTRIDQQRTLKGSTRVQTQEGTGFNNAAQDPGTQQVRAYQEVNVDYTVDQNGGGAIVIPDNKNRQVIVVGTPDDIATAEECIRLIDKRPRQVHVQVSLVELTNEGLRQLGASLNAQSQGASGNVLGGTGAALVNALPGLGAAGSSQVLTSTSRVNTNDPVQILPPGPNPLLGAFTATRTTTTGAVTTVGAPSTGYNGIIGGFFPQAVLPTIAGVTAAATSNSNFNFLALSKAAGGRPNIATLPSALNFNVQLLLQQNKARILANPSVVVSDNTEALVTLATEVIHKVTSTVSLGVTNVNVELTKAGIFLDVLPKVSEDGFIYMRIRPQVSAPTGPPQTFANQQVIVTLLNIREIIAQEVRVKDGQTLCLGGLFSEQEAAQISKVPYLAETPLFGALFRNTLKGRSRRELMLMITPKVVEEQPAVPPIAENPPATSPI
jgi:type II secretory pathway component GspD/PulD (secretin)